MNDVWQKSTENVNSRSASFTNINVIPIQVIPLGSYKPMETLLVIRSITLFWKFSKSQNGVLWGQFLSLGNKKSHGLPLKVNISVTERAVWHGAFSKDAFIKSWFTVCPVGTNSLWTIPLMSSKQISFDLIFYLELVLCHLSL